MHFNMGPKKRASRTPTKPQGSSKRTSGKRLKKGLLGVASGYNSESDQDYEPLAASKKRRTSKAGTGRKNKGSIGASLSEADDSDVDNTCGHHSDSSDSNETLRARQQRLARAAAKQSPGQAASPASRGRAKSKAAGRGRTTRTRRPQSKHPSVTTSWDELPIPVLTQIFQAVCKHGALPMAPRLACVCTSWQAAVAATPELWRILDTGAISSKAWVQQNAQGRGRGPKAARAKGKARGASAARFVSAEQGLRQWLESGRLQQLQVLVLHGEGPAGPTADVSALESESSRSGPNRQLSPGLLMQIADTCQQLRRVSLFGCLSWRPEELSRALLSMPALSELWLCGVRLSALSGLGACMCSVLEAAGTGQPQLKQLVIESCLSLSTKAVSALCPQASQPPTGANPSGLHDIQHSQQSIPTVPPPVQPLAPAFPSLEVLDLSHSGLTGRPFKLQLDDMQAAMPNLRVLKLSGLGGSLYGWMASVRDPASLPGFPHLESLHIAAALTAAHSSRMKLYAGKSYVDDALLLQLAGKSCHLHILDLSGCSVTPTGLRQLAAAHAACRAAMAPESSAAAATAAANSLTIGGNFSSPTSAAAAGEAAGDAVGAETAAAAQGGLRVRDLQLNGSALAWDEGLLAVGECCYETLEQLVVRNAGAWLGDEGLRSLSGCSKLSALDITGCSVTEQGLRDLLSALPAGVLEELHLDSCRSLSRGARQAASRGVTQLQAYLAENA